MRREEALHDVGLTFAEGTKLLKKRDHPIRVKTRSGHVCGAQSISLPLGVTPELHKDAARRHLGGDVGDLAAGATPQDRPENTQTQIRV